MLSFHFLALLSTLSATAYGGTLQVINNCNYDLSAISPQRQAEPRIPLTGGGGTLSPLENTKDTMNRYEIFLEYGKGSVITEVSNQGELSYLFYDTYVQGSNPIDGHFTMTSDSGDCPPMNSDQNLVPDSHDTAGQCRAYGASFTLTLCD